MRNKKNTALVTGASKGIGRAISKALIKNGFHLIGISRSIDVSDPEFTALSEVSGVSYKGIQADLSQPLDHEAVVKELNSRSVVLDVFVQNAGVAPLERTDVLEMNAASYQRVMDINLNGPVFFAQSMIPFLNQSDAGKFICITSISAYVASINRAEYCISKAGLSMFTKILAARLAGGSIKVFEIRPGIIETDMTRPVLSKYEALVKDGLIPLGRIGQASDVAKAVMAVVSGSLDYAHGAVIEVSGGMQVQTL